MLFQLVTDIADKGAPVSGPALLRITFEDSISGCDTFFVGTYRRSDDDLLRTRKLTDENDNADNDNCAYNDERFFYYSEAYLY
ncbi:MAG: hypothetical protein A3B31_03015 [Candidatus Komeilibacteria bacterium RIFCSPLOWO2_01_FULL_53_11]|uniref:Uncharacterized protein n=1 Tax=Candidatus Komeilibacteria bacterium RIFCSPLOWO2_01_FULL_53_11 TaxID=1798552 RepID=A0A1G2BTT8_9BACT|nr:MAG: hypothetical protein A3B31_03015 [Candidatus Komeilibacteria bacterium RIFCSPLOWO2_01_FULL_53_11]